MWSDYISLFWRSKKIYFALFHHFYCHSNLITGCQIFLKLSFSLYMNLLFPGNLGLLRVTPLLPPLQMQQTPTNCRLKKRLGPPSPAIPKPHSQLLGYYFGIPNLVHFSLETSSNFVAGTLGIESLCGKQTRRPWTWCGDPLEYAAGCNNRIKEEKLRKFARRRQKIPFFGNFLEGYDSLRPKGKEEKGGLWE